MIDLALIACAIGLAPMEAVRVDAAPHALVPSLLPAFIVAPPTRDGIVNFNPNDFFTLTLGANLPVDLLSRETVGLQLVKRKAHDGGAFYQFENPLFPAAHASLFLREGRLTGAIYHGGSLRTVVRAVKAGVSALAIEDAEQDLPCGCTGHGMQGAPVADGGIAGTACDSGASVDVLVVYTSAAVTQAGSAAALLDQIAWGFADSNEIYAGSGIPLTTRSVGTALLDGYIENANMEVDLNRLTNPGDGWIDGVHALRNSVGADLVAMVRADGGGYCGVAWLLPSNSSAESASAFSVTALGCFVGRTFTHEMGHNMGCCHALGDGGGCLAGGVFPYSLGHRFFGLDGIQYRTVMSYSPGIRIPRFSSPWVAWAGVATGIANSKDNARTISETRFAFANFRCSADGTGSCGSGGGCYSAHATPGCDDAACCNAVCAVDNFCCLTLWDSICAAEAIDLCSNCGGTSAGTCFEAHGSPSCNDAACCSSVCAVDPWCCTTSWDGICVGEAVDLCPNCGDPETGSCYIVHPNKFCDNATCCEAVCASDAFCCDVTWDYLCAGAAAANCPGCGNPNAGSCYAVQATPYCADAACCTLVCASDPFCCNSQWDSLCANAAIAGCLSCGNPSNQSCYAAHAAPYCNDPACCALVCEIDPFCCNAQWDSICADEAITTCTTCGDTATGNCFSSHGTPSCANAACCGIVCGLDPFCCDVAWDNTCVTEALDYCTQCGVAGAGSCFVSHGGTSCADSSCCASVCAVDPFCCDVAWDSICVGEAGTLCPPACGHPSTGSCYESHGTPFCADAICCETICSFDPFCCNLMWDGQCASEAMKWCPGCGNPLGGDCTVVHASPFCNDAVCCSTVCAVDPTCCDTLWDADCAAHAVGLCVNTCGGSLANDCCYPHANPTCNEPTCCAAVCAVDGFCCATAWDSICANEARLMCGQCCATDLNFDGTTNAADLSTLLGGWGTAGGDCNGDGTTNAADISLLLAAWGPCS